MNNNFEIIPSKHLHIYSKHVSIIFAALHNLEYVINHLKFDPIIHASCYEKNVVSKELLRYIQGVTKLLLKVLLK